MPGIQKSISIKNHYLSKSMELKYPIEEWKHKVDTKNIGISFWHYLNKISSSILLFIFTVNIFKEILKTWKNQGWE